jgi:hypothetical protein
MRWHCATTPHGGKIWDLFWTMTLEAVRLRAAAGILRLAAIEAKRTGKKQRK